MASLFSILSIARDGVLAQTAALDVTGRNVAGANTPGYVRRTPVLESVASGGVRMAGTARSFDRFTYSQLVDQTGRLASARSRSTTLADVEVLLTPSTDHLGDRVDALFNAFHQLSAHPSDQAVRTSVLASAGWLAAGFSETADGLEGYRAELGARTNDLLHEVNAKLESLAVVDRSIASTKARGEDPADQLDARDRLVHEIAERVGGRAIEDPAGGLTVFGAGTVLYEGGRATTLTSTIDPDGMLRIQADRGSNVIDVTRAIDSGSLAGIRQARDVDMPALLASLDTFAKEISDAINAVHVAGTALDGSGGRPLFTPAATVKGAAHAMSIDAAMIDRPELLAAASGAGDLPGGNDVAVALARLATTAMAGGATATERYATMASRMGVMRNAAASEEMMREDTVATANALRESTSGVSTDEEMIHLQQFQRAYEASTRVLRTVDELFDSLMSMVS